MSANLKTENGIGLASSIVILSDRATLGSDIGFEYEADEIITSSQGADLSRASNHDVEHRLEVLCHFDLLRLDRKVSEISDVISERMADVDTEGAGRAVLWPSEFGYGTTKLVDELQFSVAEAVISRLNVRGTSFADCFDGRWLALLVRLRRALELAYQGDGFGIFDELVLFALLGELKSLESLGPV